jgi:cytochrome c1
MKTPARTMTAAGRVLAGAALCILSACGEAAAPAMPVEGGDPVRGALAIDAYGCGACHTIPGIPGADATVGPPLAAMARRGYVAGVLPNTPDHLIRWIRNPRAVDPRTAMPDLGVSAAEARDMAAYLYSVAEP